MSVKTKLKIFVLTAGDPASVASFLTLKTWLDLKNNNEFCFCVVSNIKMLKDTMKFYGLDVPIAKINSPKETPAVFKNHLPVIDIELKSNVELGKPNALNASFVLKSIELACEFCLNGSASGIVTNPFNKSVMRQSGFNFDGHTEYIHHITKSPSYSMMLTDSSLAIKTIPIFIHKSLRYVLENLNYDLLFSSVLKINQNFKQTFGFAPKIALSGLNPHAGENGNMGFEELDIINPCCNALRSEKNINISNALPPDTLFVKNVYKEHDLIVTIYHDQALAPFKALCFENGVNTTIGLNLVRTSPDHGTAYGLVKNKEMISNSSLISAFKVAYLLSKYKESL